VIERAYGLRLTACGIRCCSRARVFAVGRGLLAVGLVALASLPVASAQQPELIERTMAIVGGQVITLSEVRTALALGLVQSQGTDPITAGTQKLIERALILREVQRYAPPEPAVDAVNQAVSAARNRVADPNTWQQILDAGGVSEGWLRDRVRDDLRIANYLTQRFAGGAPDEARRQELITDWISELRRRTTVVELYKK
jgi:hypothetical protein